VSQTEKVNQLQAHLIHHDESNAFSIETGLKIPLIQTFVILLTQLEANQEMYTFHETENISNIFARSLQWIIS
jgi:hypothetical protein